MDISQGLLRDNTEESLFPYLTMVTKNIFDTDCRLGLKNVWRPASGFPITGKPRLCHHALTKKSHRKKKIVDDNKIKGSPFRPSLKALSPDIA